MFSRSDLKSRAKAGLKIYYWHGFVISFLIFFLNKSLAVNSSGGTGGEIVDSSGNVVSGGGGYITDMLDELSKVAGQLDTRLILFTLGSVAVTVSFIGLMTVILSTFITNLLEVGKAGFYVKSRREQKSAGIGQAFSCFTKKTYFPVLKTMFLRELYTALWTLLLVVPGVIKRYEYFMVPYILSEDPTMPTSEVLKLSRELMKDHKWECFILQLSFLGWFLLGSVFCGVGVTFVYPYYDATMTEFYEGLKGIHENPEILLDL